MPFEKAVSGTDWGEAGWPDQALVIAWRASGRQDVLTLLRILRANILIGGAIWYGIDAVDQPGEVSDREEGAITWASGDQIPALIVTFDHMGLGDFFTSFDGKAEHGRVTTHYEYGGVRGQHFHFATEKPGCAIDRYDLAMLCDCSHVSAMRRRG